MKEILGRKSLWLLIGFLSIGALHADNNPPAANEKVAADELIVDLANKAFRWLVDHQHPESGLISDRAPRDPNLRIVYDWAAISATGYYLSALPEAIPTLQISSTEALSKTKKILRSLLRSPRHHGFFPQFINWADGGYWRDAEGRPYQLYSTLDSSILFNGIMVAQELFKNDSEVQTNANLLLSSLDWSVMANGQFVTLGRDLSFTPPRELGPLDIRSSEFLMTYILAAGGRDGQRYAAMYRNTRIEWAQVQNRRILNDLHPLFTSYYGLGWADLRDSLDPDGIDYHANAVQTALANRDFSRNYDHPTYSARKGGFWGISAGDFPRAVMRSPNDSDVYRASCMHKISEGYDCDPLGTVWPTTALAALPWAPTEILADLANWKKTDPALWNQVNGPYGILPFNLLSPVDQKMWIARDYIGIDLGSFYIDVANYRHGSVWQHWMNHPIAKAGLARLEFMKAEDEPKTLALPNVTAPLATPLVSEKNLKPDRVPSTIEDRPNPTLQGPAVTLAP